MTWPFSKCLLSMFSYCILTIKINGSIKRNISQFFKYLILNKSEKKRIIIDIDYDRSYDNNFNFHGKNSYNAKDSLVFTYFYN